MFTRQTCVTKSVHPNRQAPHPPTPYPFIALEEIVPPLLATLSKFLCTPGNQLHPAGPCHLFLQPNKHTNMGSGPSKPDKGIGSGVTSARFYRGASQSRISVSADPFPIVCTCMLQMRAEPPNVAQTQSILAALSRCSPRATCCR